MDKETVLNLNLNPYFKETIETNIVVWSHDKNSYRFNFNLFEYLKRNPFYLIDGEPRIILEFLNSKNQAVHIYPLDIDDAVKGLAHFIVPDKILGYQGYVKASITVDFEDKTHDLGNFTFEMKRSAIDKEEIELENYVKEFDEALERINEIKDEIENIDFPTKEKIENLEKNKVDEKTVDEKIRNIDVSCTNLILNSINKEVTPFSYDGEVEKNNNVKVSEWKTSNAKSIKGKTNQRSKTIGTLATGKKDPNNKTRDNFNYIHAIYVKNNHKNNILTVSNNILTVSNNIMNDVKVMPGEVKRVVLRGSGDGEQYLQFNFLVDEAGYDYDFVYYQPMIAEGNTVASFSLAPEDFATKEDISNINKRIDQLLLIISNVNKQNSFSVPG